MEDFFYSLRDFLWSGPLLALLVGAGIILTWQNRLIQYHGLLSLFRRDSGHHLTSSKSQRVTGDISSLQSLMTALAGAIGTGNITGIATAVISGGFGALFWMWVAAFFGMATAYAETLLAVKYRVANQNNEVIGGPMVTLKQALNAKGLAIAFSIFGGIAGFGYAMVQSNSVVDAMVSFIDVDRGLLGLLLAIITGGVIIGGVQRVAKAASALVPCMAVLYLGMSLIVLCYHANQIIPAFSLILSSAFSGQAILGGALGTMVLKAIQNGVQYGIFANEAGLGSFAIAGACAKTPHPVKQGFLAMTGVFISTMVVCTITGLVLAVTSVAGATTSTGELVSGSPLALMAFESVYHHFGYVVMLCLCFFAFTTILAWAYYGEKCLEFLFGLQCVKYYRWLYIGCVGLGAVMSLKFVWAFAHLANGFMAIPNIISMIRLRRVVQAETADYLGKSATKPISVPNPAI